MDPVMPTIRHQVVFKNTQPKDLYDLYMDSKKHTAVTGAPAKMSTKEGGKYSAHGNYISGENLKLVRDRLIVQTWRAENWGPLQADSTFILFLEPNGKDTILHMIHAGVPEKEKEDLDQGWKEHYWKPMKKHLSAKKKKKQVAI